MRREKRLTWLMVAGVAAPLLLFAGFAALGREAALRDARDMTRDRVAVMREHVTQILRFEEKVLRLADSLLQARGAQPDHAFLKNLVAGQQTDFPVAAVDAQGRVTAVSGAPETGGVRVDDRAYFRQALAGDAAVLGEPTTTRVSGLQVIPFAVGRSDGSGVFVAALRIDYFMEVFADAAGEARGAVTVALIRDDGTFLARYPRAEDTLRLPPDAPFLSHVQSALSGTFEARRVTDGADLIASYARLAPYPAYVAFTVERAHALAPWRRDLAVGGALAVLAALVLGGLAHSARRQARQARRGEERLAAEVALRTREADGRALEAEQASQDARRALAAVERADRAKVHFLAAVSHDLRQPLQALRLFMDFTASKGAEVAHRALGAQARQAVEQMERLLSTTLDMSMLDNGALDAEVRSVPLGPILAELRRDFAPEAAKKGLDLVVVPTSVVVRSDPVLLRRILTNLVSNAIRYTLQGRVLVGVRRGGGPRVLVVDTGIGLAEDDAAGILEGRAPSPAPGDGGARRQGLGVGLSIVRRMAALLGHEMTVASRLRQGSCFTVRLRDAPATAPEASGGARPAALADRRAAE